MDLWEGTVFALVTKDKRVHKARRTLTRKLRLAPGDITIHGPYALADQADHFWRQQEDQNSRWLSVFAPFIAFDMVCLHIMPSFSRKTLSPPGSVPYQKVLLEKIVVDVSVR